MFFHSLKDIVFSWGFKVCSNKNLCRIVLDEGEVINNFSHAIQLANQPVNPINKDHPWLLLQSQHHGCDVNAFITPIIMVLYTFFRVQACGCPIVKVQAVCNTFQYVDAVYCGWCGNIATCIVTQNRECCRTHFVDASMKFLRGFCSSTALVVSYSFDCKSLGRP